MQRILGRIRGESSGPSLVVMAGIHGNEITGPRAAQAVLGRIRKDALPVHGEVIFVSGNLKALETNQRFIDVDLNRAWTPERVARVSAGQEQQAEDEELRKLLAIFADVVSAARGPIHFIDLHTSSAEGAPFLTVGDTLRNREFARKIPLPMMLGLEDQIDGSLLEFLNNFGFVTVGVEAGQHVADSSADRHEAVLWLALVAAGILDVNRAPALEPYRKLLKDASSGVPTVLEVRHRHSIESQDGFRMEPGFTNFQPIVKGQQLATDRNGPIFCKEDGRILLPLYQGQGDDGFFISREFRAFWLHASRVLRRMRVGRIVHLLPGVRRHPDRPGVLQINTRVARVYPLEIFHLLGFRKLRETDGQLWVSRRKYDLSAPRRISFG